MNKIKTIILKEWAEVFKQRLVLFTVIFIPFLFTGMALGIILATGDTVVDAASMQDFPGDVAATICAGVAEKDCFSVYLATQFMFMFMMIPVIIPVTIAAYSIVGEKTTRSLEPLLATPITTGELLAGKALAAILPAVAATWLGFIIFLVGMFIKGGTSLFTSLTQPLWLVAILAVGPLLALLSVASALMVSSRVSDPRVAEQLSAVVVVPLVLLAFGQMAGLIILDRNMVLLIAGILLILDAAAIYVAVRIFQRETILTKWK